MYQTIRLLHLYPGNDPRKVLCKRDGIQWNLDLAEGIDLAIYAFGKFETTTANLFKRMVKPGMTVFDVGANIGAHTLPLAHLVGDQGTVYAFEPTDWAVTKLKTNLSLNPNFANRVKLQQAFLSSNSSGNKVDEVYASWSLEEKKVDPVHGGVAFKLNNVPTLSIDEFVEAKNISKIDFFKIDVDGFEVEVLRGAKKSFAKFRPPILIELCPYIFERYNYSMDQLLDFFKENNYSLISLDESKKYPMNKDLYKLIPENGSINALALPN